MELGQKIKTARQELGLSQRQLCDGKITRNMLSQIENGSARPSMDTLAYLARRLGKSVSFFLEEQAVVSPNIALMAAARTAYAKDESRKALEILADYAQPDALFENERLLLEFLCCIGEAEKALRDGRIPYAQAVLSRAASLSGPYITRPLKQRLFLLRSKAGEDVPLSDDEMLLARAGAASDPRRALQILAACEDKAAEEWHFLTAEAHFGLGAYAEARAHYTLCEEAYGEKVWPKLEACCRELEDYKAAYAYACKQK